MNKSNFLETPLWLFSYSRFVTPPEDGVLKSSAGGEWDLVIPINFYLDNGVHSSLFRGKASGGHSKARQTRDAQFLQKVTRRVCTDRRRPDPAAALQVSPTSDTCQSVAILLNRPHCIYLRQDPLEAILVIFGRRALIFFVWKLLEKMKNDTTFVRMRSGDHLGDAKMSKKGTSLRRI